MKIFFYMLIIAGFILVEISSAQTGSVKIADTAAAAYTYVEIPLTASNLSNIGAVSIRIKYDTDVLQFDSLANKVVPFIYSDINGVISFSWADFTLNNPINISNGKLLDLAFSYKMGNSSISFIKEDCEFGNSSGQEVPVELLDGSIAVLLTDLNDDVVKTGSFNLFQNYPNPFNPVTKIFYSIPENLFVELRLYDCLGNTMLTLVNEEQGPGIYSVEVNSNNLANGIYFYRLIAGRHIETKKMIVIK